MARAAGTLAFTLRDGVWRLGEKFGAGLDAVDGELRRRLAASLDASLEHRSPTFGSLPVRFDEPALTALRTKLRLDGAAPTLERLRDALRDPAVRDALGSADWLLLHGAVHRAVGEEATKLQTRQAELEAKAAPLRQAALATAPDRRPATVVADGRAWIQALQTIEDVRARRATLLGEPPPEPSPELARANELVAAAEALEKALAATGQPHRAALEDESRRLEAQWARAETLVANGGCHCGFGEAGTSYARRCVLVLQKRPLVWSTFEESDCRGLCAAWKRDGYCARYGGAADAESALVEARRQRDAAGAARDAQAAGRADVEAADARLTAARKAIAPSSESPAPRAAPSPPQAPSEPQCPLQTATLVLRVPPGSTVDVGGLRLSAPSGIVRIQTPAIPACRGYYYGVRTWVPTPYGLAARDYTVSVTPGFVTEYAL